ncbi:hypothetical protein [Phenylobacterium aquaticum]|uniref:hypothetical protein n=1 Tax=Phenylobacterium aquaticum TaxID=1763816 RepID=UPI0026EEF311|nr:hypothetical protein [Phenylobacterium aquaticum]
MTVSFDPSLLSAYYNARSGVTAAADAASSTTSAKRYVPTAPWTPSANRTVSNDPDLMTTAVKNAMVGHKLVDENAAKLDLTGASDDYKKMFALYQGLDTLNGVANQINGKGLTSVDKDRIKAVFAKGLSEVTSYTEGLKLSQVRLTRGDAMDKAQMAIGVAKSQPDYATPALVSGDVTQPVQAFQGDVKFNISVKRIGVTHDIPIDLSEMGTTPRNMANVVNFINDKLEASGVATRVASQRIPGGDRNVTVGGKSVKVGTNPDSWSLKIKVDSGDTVTFKAAATAGSVYLAQSVGNPNPTTTTGATGKVTTTPAVTNSQIVKFQTDTTAVAAPPQPAGASNWVDGRVWSSDMEKTVGTVHSTKVGPDGSVYVLADVTGKVSGQDIKGAQDVALMKYDSAGKLMFTRTLGAASNASGLALAVSDTGQVAIAGKVTGTLDGATNGALNSGDTGSFATNTDSFVTVMDANGQDIWTQRRGARQNDEATNIAFGADGSVYVAGRSQSTMPGGSQIGGWDSYVEGFKADAAGKVSTLFTQTVGSAGADRPGGMVVDGGALVLANNEDGHAVLHRFDLSSGTPTETATRDLGDLQGGDIAGLALNGGQLVLAGSTANPALAAGTVSRAQSGGMDAFVAQVNSDLTAAATDAVAYYGGAGDDKVTGLAVSAGKVFITGQAGSDLPDAAAVGKKDGFLAQIDVATGDIGFARRFTGKDGYATPTAIAASSTGASILDQIGLPQGTLNTTDSQQITAVTSIRAGDQFQVRAGSTGTLKTVTIDSNDTLDTLATKVRRSLGYQAKVEVVTVDGTKRLKVTPVNARDTLEFFGGASGKDALALLGLSEGVVRETVTDKNGKSTPADGNGQIYGLKMDKNLKLDTSQDVSHALAEIATAMGVIRTAYQDLKTAAQPASVTAAAKAANGPVPAYLTAQIASYKDALARLGG